MNLLRKKKLDSQLGSRKYTVIQQEGLNVLVETEASKAKRAERRDNINMLFSVISAFAAVIAAVFAALTYINP